MDISNMTALHNSHKNHRLGVYLDTNAHMGRMPTTFVATRWAQTTKAAQNVINFDGQWTFGCAAMTQHVWDQQFASNAPVDSLVKPMIYIRMNEHCCEGFDKI